MIDSEKDQNLLYQYHLLQLHQKGQFWLQILLPFLQTRIVQARITCTLHPDIITMLETVSRSKKYNDTLSKKSNIFQSINTETDKVSLKNNDYFS